MDVKLGFPRKGTNLLLLIVCSTACGTVWADEQSDAAPTVVSDQDQGSPLGESTPVTMSFSDAGQVGGDGPELLPPLTGIEAPITDESSDPLPPVVVDSTVAGFDDSAVVEVVTEPACDPDPPDECVSFGDWLGYNSAQSSTTWLSGKELGMFSLESFPTLELGSDSAIVFGTGLHFLNGPVEPDMPPRLFDFQVGYHARRAVSGTDFLDVKFGVGAFSDFEGSARKGVRYPGHAVAYHQWDPEFISVFGVEVLDRDDISVLPVAGIVCRPLDDLMLELVFPRPRVQLRVREKTAMYVAGELGGGTWAIERVDRRYDNATYRDLRVIFGVTDFGDKSDGVLEFGFAFDRSLEYRSTVGDRSLDSTFILRSHVYY